MLLLAGGVGYARAAGQIQREAAPLALPPDPVAVGQALFVAKGCVVCHSDENIRSQTGLFNGAAAPSLSGYRSDPVYLRTWLKDPQELKPDTAMPNLELREEEIEALIVYLNQE